MEENTPMLFEASWEVTNKVGGIYTVIRSKIPLMKMHYDNYFLIGPLFNYVPIDFIQETPPSTFSEIFDQLATQNIRCIYGTWDVPGRPTTILIDAKGLFDKKDNIKAGLWNDFGIDSLYASYDFEEPLVWSWAVGQFLRVVEEHFKNNKIITHLHEWLSGFALLYLKQHKSKIATVLTTHATMLGRSIASNNKNYFDILKKIDPLEEAKKLRVVDKFTTEKACALQADVFTTVSEITAEEASIIFGRKPDVLPNGLPLDSYPTFEGASYNHLVNKEQLQKYIVSHFFPYETFDLENTLFYYTSGRYEFENKGMHYIIKSLGKLNRQLREEGSKRSVIMFFFLAVTAGGPRQELLENTKNVEELFNSVKSHSESFFKKVVENLLTKETKDLKLCSGESLDQLRRRAKTIKRKGLSAMTTHVVDEEHDRVVQACIKEGLNNEPEDKVKIVIVHSFLNGRDGLINMSYNDVVNACHLGIFPSHYEPWGYTPLESISLGVPAITSSYAGFGQHIKPHLAGAHPGVFVLDLEQEDNNITEDLYKFLERYLFLSKQNRVATKMNAHALSTYADWRQLIQHYLEAHQKALKKINNKLEQ